MREHSRDRGRLEDIVNYVSRCNATSLTLTGRNGKKVKILIRK